MTPLHPHPTKIKTHKFSLEIQDSEEMPSTSDVHEEEPSELEEYEWIPNWLMGETPSLKKYLSTKTAALWLLVRFVDAILRGAGSPMFLSNPFCGIMVIVVMAIEVPSLTYGALIGIVSAIIMALFMFQEWASISSGAKTFNGFLLGLYLTAISPLEVYPWIATHIVIGSCLSVLIASSLGNLLSKLELPTLNAPFNILGLMTASYKVVWENMEQEPSLLSSTTTPATPTAAVDWAKVGEGLLLTPGQIYGCSTMISAGLLYAACFIFSPILCIMNFLGAAIGMLLGLYLCEDYNEVYEGMWSYNALLTTGAIGAIFFKVSFCSILTALGGAVLATTMFGFMRGLTDKTRYPVLAFPFIFSTWLLLNTITRNGLLQRKDLVVQEKLQPRATKQQLEITKVRPKTRQVYMP